MAEEVSAQNTDVFDFEQQRSEAVQADKDKQLAKMKPAKARASSKPRARAGSKSSAKKAS